MKKTDLDFYREQLDLIDKDIIFTLKNRFDIIKKIGEYKKENNINIFQKERWEKVLNSKKILAKKNKVSEKLVEDIWNLIHTEALKIEEKV